MLPALNWVSVIIGHLKDQIWKGERTMSKRERWLELVSQMVMAGLAGMVCGQWMAAWIWAGAWL